MTRGAGDESLSDFDLSQKAFWSAFPNGFPWELIKVLSGPPEIVFMWRHWSNFDGEFNGKKGDGEKVEMFGMTKAEVIEEEGMTRLKKVEVYFDPEAFLKVRLQYAELVVL